MWITNDGGKLVLDREKAKVVRRLFAMIVEAVGLTTAARTLNDEKVPVLGRTRIAIGGQLGKPKDEKKRQRVVWSAGTIYKMVTSRATLGEYQPHAGRPGDRRPSGNPISNYYPAVITPELFAAAGAMRLRGRVDVAEGETRPPVRRPHPRRADRRHHVCADLKLPAQMSVLFPSGAMHGRGERWTSFPLAAFEDAIRSELIEVKVKDIQAETPEMNAVETLSVVLGRNWKHSWRSGGRRWIGRTGGHGVRETRGPGGRACDVVDRLAEMQVAVALPISEAIGNLRTVGRSLKDDGSDENRLRCQSAIRRAVESVWCLFLPGRGRRIAAVQVWFRGGAQRSYMIVHRPAVTNAKSTREATTEVRSFADATLPVLDLRDRKQAS